MHDLNPEFRAIQNKKFFSKISAQEEGILHEEESIYGSTDRLCAAPGRDGHAGFRSLPQDGNIGRDVFNWKKKYGGMGVSEM